MYFKTFWIGLHVSSYLSSSVRYAPWKGLTFYIGIWFHFPTVIEIESQGFLSTLLWWRDFLLFSLCLKYLKLTFKTRDVSEKCGLAQTRKSLEVLRCAS